MKTLELSTNIDHSFVFNSKVSSIVDDYLCNKEITKSGLKRKREPENIVGTKKSKKEAKKTIKFETANHFKFKLVHGYIHELA